VETLILNEVIQIDTSQLHYRFLEKELKTLLSSLIIQVDSREKVNEHILNYFNDKGIAYETTKLNAGDYSVVLPANPELGLPRSIFFPIAIERKNSIDELAVSIKNRTVFEHELLRSERLKFLLMVEDEQGYKNILAKNYRSQYDPRALLGSLKAFEAKYGFGTAFVGKELAGHFIFHHLFYHARAILKGN
jgi:ERCC4-type nuclease